jgi:hypothetical protein
LGAEAAETAVHVAVHVNVNVNGPQPVRGSVVVVVVVVVDVVVDVIVDGDVNGDGPSLPRTRQNSKTPASFASRGRTVSARAAYRARWTRAAMFCFGAAPTILPTTSPFLKMNSVGTPLMP